MVLGDTIALYYLKKYIMRIPSYMALLIPHITVTIIGKKPTKVRPRASRKYLVS